MSGQVNMVVLHRRACSWASSKQAPWPTWLGATFSVVSGGAGCLVATVWIAATTPALLQYVRTPDSPEPSVREPYCGSNSIVISGIEFTFRSGTFFSNVFTRLAYAPPEAAAAARHHSAANRR
jgi:hypothetical protein